MKQHTWLWGLALAATLTLAACGGSTTEEGDNGSSAGSSSTSSGAPGGSSNSTKVDGNVPSELKKALESQAKKNFTATYSFAMAGSASTDLTMAQKGSYTYVLLGRTDEIQLTSITRGDTSYSCTRMVSGSASCEKKPTSENAGVTDFTFGYVVDDLERVVYKKIADRSVNGRDSQCWEVNATDKQAVCIGKKGGELTLVQLLAYTMELKEYSDTADDKLFNPPYPVE